MKYGPIKNKEQFSDYTKKHLSLGKILASGDGTPQIENEYYILDLIIRDYHDKQESPFDHLTPVDLLKSLMKEYQLTGEKLSKEIGVSKSIISEILNYKRGFSKSLIRKLSSRFRMNEKSFLKDYELIGKPSNVA